MERYDLKNKVSTELTQESATQAMLDMVLKINMFKYMDNLSSEVLLNSSLMKYEQQAVKNPNALKPLLKDMFGEAKVEKVMADLKGKKVTDDTAFLVYNKLLDYKPLDRGEMPVTWNMSGGSRIFYMLKSYTLKQMDVYYREIIKDATKNGKLSAVKNAAALGSLLTAAGMGTDLIKDLILGRVNFGQLISDPRYAKDEATTKVVDNLVRLSGLQKYQIYKARQEGVQFLLSSTILPPARTLEKSIKEPFKPSGTYKDWWDFLKNNDIMPSVPVVGNLEYWWWGGGQKVKEKRIERSLRESKRPLSEAKKQLKNAKTPEEITTALETVNKFRTSTNKQLEQKISSLVTQQKAFEKMGRQDMAKDLQYQINDAKKELDLYIKSEM